MGLGAWERAVLCWGSSRERSPPIIFQQSRTLIGISLFEFFCTLTKTNLICRQVISSNKSICTLQITDTAGSHQFPAMQRLSISKGHAFILVYSVCSKQSLEELRQIWALIKELKVRMDIICDKFWTNYLISRFFSFNLQSTDISQIPVMLVGNKIDESAELREVTHTEGISD